MRPVSRLLTCCRDVSPSLARGSADFNAFKIALAAAMLIVGSAMLSGCGFDGRAGSMRAQSLRDRSVILPGEYATAIYKHDPAQGTSIILSSIPARDVIDGKAVDGQLLHIDLLWLPKPGATPMDSSATNAMIRHVVISNGEIGVYGGAGFALPDDGPEGSSLRVTLRDASLQLQDATPGFVDLLSPAQLTGSFTARRDDQKTRQLLHAASQLVTNALGRTRYVGQFE